MILHLVLRDLIYFSTPRSVYRQVLWGKNLLRLNYKTSRERFRCRKVRKVSNQKEFYGENKTSRDRVFQ